MTAAALTAIVTGAVFCAVNLAVSAAVWMAWPTVSAACRHRVAHARARWIFAWRAAPTVAAAVTALAVGLSFAVLEPASTDERPGGVLWGLAGAGAGLALASAARVAAHVVATARFLRCRVSQPIALAWPGPEGPAWAVDSEFPLVAVVGFRRPRLVVARSVAEACTPPELAAIAAHERWHVLAGDNLRRLWLSGFVDALSWTRRSAAMNQAWQDATEDAADDHAAASGAGALELAGALLTVARLAPGVRPALHPSITCFYRGGAIERRVRRLLAMAGGPAVPQPARGFRWRLVLVAAAATLWLAGDVARGLYGAAEWMVQHLP